jgi:hypothetical protein
MKNLAKVAVMGIVLATNLYSSIVRADEQSRVCGLSEVFSNMEHSLTERGIELHVDIRKNGSWLFQPIPSDGDTDDFGRKIVDWRREVLGVESVEEFGEYVKRERRRYCSRPVPMS